MSASKPNGKSTVPPNQTLYCTNLPDKLQKYDLKRALYTLFATYGAVLDVVTLKTAKMRGQAHVVFKDISTATQAMRDLQGFEFFGKEIKIEYGKGRSNIISRLEGTVVVPESVKQQEDANAKARSIFTHPSMAAGAAGNAASGGLKPEAAGPSDGGKSPQGVKRPREDEEAADESDDVSMEEDDEGEEMDVSD